MKVMIIPFIMIVLGALFVYYSPSTIKQWLVEHIFEILVPIIGATVVIMLFVVSMPSLKFF